MEVHEAGFRISDKGLIFGGRVSRVSGFRI